MEKRPRRRAADRAADRLARRAAGAGRRMRIGELCARTGISRQTIHYYLREGLLPRPRKASRNMAWYDEGHLERLLLVKRLQHEKFLPLAVIKRILEGGRLREGGATDLALLLQAAQAVEAGPSAGAMGEREIRRRTGLAPAEIRRAAEAGLVAPERRGAQASYSEVDARVLELLATAVRVAGYDFDFAVESFALGARHMAALERDEARLVFERLMTSGSPIELIESVRRGREVQSRFLALQRARLLQREIEDYLLEVEQAVALSGGRPAYPLGEAVLEGRGHAARRARLEALAERDSEQAVALVSLLYGTGAGPSELALAERAAELRGRHGDLGGLLLYEGMARVDAGEFEPGIALLRRAAQALPASTLSHAALGSAAVRLGRRILLESGAATAMRQIAAGLEELGQSETATAGELGDRLWARFLRGRVYTSLPRFFGSHARGVAELDALAAEKEDGSPAHRALAETGVLARLRGNALFFLGVALENAGRPADARAALLAAGEVDPKGPLGERARERLQGVRP